MPPREERGVGKVLCCNPEGRSIRPTAIPYTRMLHRQLVTLEHVTDSRRRRPNSTKSTPARRPRRTSPCPTERPSMGQYVARCSDLFSICKSVPICVVLDSPASSKCGGQPLRHALSSSAFVGCGLICTGCLWRGCLSGIAKFTPLVLC